MAKAARKLKAVPAPAEPLRLDLGCGVRPLEGFVGVDSIKFPGVGVVADLTKKWPWADSSVDEARASHFLEHLDAKGRAHFANELWRVLKPGGRCQIIVPSWKNSRAYGDPTHQWPPVTEWTFLYWSKTWRLGVKGDERQSANAPHVDGPPWFICDFDASPAGWTLDPVLVGRTEEFMQRAIRHGMETTTDMIVWVTAKKE